ncbi:MAG: hypothetical protein JXP73_00740 [Deltaproteobacteria bacterium]|nr:hypothetical protein [Deltaproteobacteria bacterium]
MRNVAVAFLLLWSSMAAARVTDVEFSYTPFVGDPRRSNVVETVPGKASLYVNNVVVAEQVVEKKDAPVLFDEREVAASYKMLEANRDINLTGFKKTGCLGKGYAAGIRVGTCPQAQLEFVTSGNPEVVGRCKAGALFFSVDPKALERIKEVEVQACIITVLSALYPPRLVFVRSASGKWEVAY